MAVGTTAEERQLGRIVGQTLAAPLDHLDVRVREQASKPTERLIDGLAQALPDARREALTLRVALMSSALAGLRLRRVRAVARPRRARSGPDGARARAPHAARDGLSYLAKRKRTSAPTAPKPSRHVIFLPSAYERP